ncbi:MAG: c-type cytochrome [Dehalococcoidia bacterium]|nr:c-type cytochrome [Dehalococcoidia bacterium]
MNTSKQVNVMVGLLMVFLVGTLLYFLWDSARADEATERQLRVNAERGGALFALNCRSCHGLTGQGPLERGGLPGVPLNLSANREGSAGQILALQNRMRDTIVCGRVGTVMPAWSQAQNGPLNDFQIEQLVALITGRMLDGAHDPLASELGWAHAVERAAHHDEFAPPKRLEADIGKGGTTLALDSVDGIKAEDVLRLDDDPVDGVYELVVIKSVSEGSGKIEVERGAMGTAASAHKLGSEVFKGPVLPGTTINGEIGTPPCGQKAAAPAATPGPPVQVSGTADVTMGDNFFKFGAQQNPPLEVTAGQAVTFNLKNGGNAPHNLRIAGPDNKFDTDDDTVSSPDLVPPGSSATLTTTLPAGAGSYRCDFHPLDMKGDITAK